MYIYMYMCMYTYVYVCVYMSMYACMCEYVNMLYTRNEETITLIYKNIICFFSCFSFLQNIQNS